MLSLIILLLKVYIIKILDILHIYTNTIFGHLNYSSSYFRIRLITYPMSNSMLFASSWGCPKRIHIKLLLVVTRSTTHSPAFKKKSGSSGLSPFFVPSSKKTIPRYLSQCENAFCLGVCIGNLISSWGICSPGQVGSSGK